MGVYRGVGYDLLCEKGPFEITAQSDSQDTCVSSLLGSASHSLFFASSPSHQLSLQETMQTNLRKEELLINRSFRCVQEASLDVAPEAAAQHQPRRQRKIQQRPVRAAVVTAAPDRPLALVHPLVMHDLLQHRGVKDPLPAHVQYNEDQLLPRRAAAIVKSNIKTTVREVDLLLHLQEEEEVIVRRPHHAV